MSKKEALQREYWFDPTANQALAHVDRPKRLKNNISYVVDHASPPEILRFKGVIFEPKPPNIPSLAETRRCVSQLETRRAELIQQYGRRNVQAVSEFQELTVQLFAAKERNETLKRLRSS